MSAPYDRPAHGEPGGCECFDCGVIFIGAPWHTQCAVCAQGIDAAAAGETREAGLDAKHESAVGNADAPHSPIHPGDPNNA